MSYLFQNRKKKKHCYEKVSLHIVSSKDKFSKIISADCCQLWHIEKVDHLDMSLPGRNFSSAGYFQTPRASGLVKNYALRGVLDKPKASKSEMVF